MASSIIITPLLPQQVGEAVLRMVHTHDGAAAACMALAYGSAKDRKRLVKAMKGHALAMATNE